MSIQKIVSRWDASVVLFECELPDGLDSGMAMRHALEKATVSGAYLSGAYLSDAYLSGANLSGANLSGANLRGAYLRGAYLIGANLIGANLSGANLSGAYLSGANLSDAYLSGVNLSDANLIDANLIVPAAAQIERLDAVREIILDDAARLQMDHWHGSDGWRDRTCAEEAVCGTTHCLAGWLQVCSTDPVMRDKDPERAGFLIAPIAAPLFFSRSDKVLTWLRDREYVKQLEGIARQGDAA